VVATGIFTLLLLTLLAMRFKRRWPAVVLFPNVRPQRGEGRGAAVAVLWLFGLIIAANAVAVFFESGLHWYLPDTPRSYRLLEGQ
jgi:hypothetical protein